MGYVLVTGASGYIGHKLVLSLINSGFDVKGFSKGTARSSIVNFKCITVDIEKPVEASLLLGCETVVHLAGIVHKGSHKSERDYLSVNTVGTFNLAVAASKAGVRHFIFISSVAAVVDTQGKPLSPYGYSKLVAEDLLRSLGSVSPMRITVLRLPMVYGPSCPGNIKRLLWLAENRIPLPFASISNGRSFLFVGNLTSALVQCCKKGPSKKEIYVITDGTDISTATLARALVKGTGVGKVVAFPNSILRLISFVPGFTDLSKLIDSLKFDSSAFSEDFDWKPPYSISEALNETFASASI